MAWIKRNIRFVLGCLVALGLMGWAGWYLYSKMALNDSIRGQLGERYAELDHWNNLDPHPGDGKKVDNVKLAGEQQQELRDFINKARKHFARIPPIPDSTNVTSYDFARQLPATIDQLSRDATNASVTLPPGFYFSFQAQKGSMTLAPGSLEPLATKLGEVKAICDILFQARINSLDGLRRERVSSDDSSVNVGSADYLEAKSVTNELAVLTPYEVAFRSFSSELGAVLAGLANSPHCLIVKTIQVEPGPATVSPSDTTAAVSPPTPVPFPSPIRGSKDADRLFRERYGLRAPVPPPVVVAPPAVTPGRGGLPTVINEGPLKVTLRIEVVKLREGQKEKARKPSR